MDNLISVVIALTPNEYYLIMSKLLALKVEIVASSQKIQIKKYLTKPPPPLFVNQSLSTSLPINARLAASSKDIKLVSKGSKQPDTLIQMNWKGLMMLDWHTVNLKVQDKGIIVSLKPAAKGKSWHDRLFGLKSSTNLTDIGSPLQFGLPEWLPNHLSLEKQLDFEGSSYRLDPYEITLVNKSETCFIVILRNIITSCYFKIPPLNSAQQYNLSSAAMSNYSTHVPAGVGNSGIQKQHPKDILIKQVQDRLLATFNPLVDLLLPATYQQLPAQTNRQSSVKRLTGKIEPSLEFLRNRLSEAIWKKGPVMDGNEQLVEVAFKVLEMEAVTRLLLEESKYNDKM